MIVQPDGDIWMLSDNDEMSQYYQQQFRFNFSYIVNERIKKVVKAYIWSNYSYKNRTVTLLYHRLLQLKHFVEFASQNNIEDMQCLTNTDILNYMSYLATVKSKGKGNVLTYESQKKHFDALKSIIRWGQLHAPTYVPQKEIFTGGEYLKINQKSKIEFIPDDVLAQINMALVNEKNPYVKYGIIILEYTGMRIGDLLLLKKDCISPDIISGSSISWYDHKNRKKRAPMPVRNECVIAIERLLESTQEIRNHAAENIKDYLFIRKVSVSNASIVKGDIVKIRQAVFGEWLNKFVKENRIFGSDGDLYNLNCHEFRRTLATDMLSKGVSINVVGDVLGINVSNVRYHYADIKDKERAELFSKIGIIGNINLVNSNFISDPAELSWFKENKDKGARMCDGYCTNPITDGKICDRLLARRKCYTCSRYITTPEYLEKHKANLNELEIQLANNIYGEHYAEHLKPTIEVLKAIIIRLEALNEGNK